MNDRPLHRVSGRDERGQASVELVLALPIITMLLLVIVQVGLIVRAQVMVVHAARDAVRHAAVSSDPTRSAKAAVSIILGKERTSTETLVGDGELRVVVTYHPELEVPLVSAFFGAIDLRAEASMQIER